MLLRCLGGCQGIAKVVDRGVAMVLWMVAIVLWMVAMDAAMLLWLVAKMLLDDC